MPCVTDVVPPANMATQGFNIASVSAYADDDTRTLCGHCRNVVNPDEKGVRLVSKTKQIYKCQQCNVTLMQLHRKMPFVWQSKSEMMSDDDRAAFFDASRGLNVEETVQLFEKKADAYEYREKAYRQGGDFLPLSVWQTQGFDIMAITNNSEACDVRPDRMFGHVYRVPILSVWETGGKGSRRTDTASSGSGLPALRTAAGGGATSAVSAPADGRGRKRSGSSDSSSCSEVRKARRAAKNEKRRLQKENDAERQRTKELKDAERQAQKDAKLREVAEKKASIKLCQASKGLAKQLDKTITELEKSLRAPGASLVPAEHRKPVLDILDTLRTWCSSAQNHAEGIPGDIILPSTDEVKEKLTDSKKRSVIFVQLAKTLLSASRTSSS